MDRDSHILSLQMALDRGTDKLASVANSNARRDSELLLLYATKTTRTFLIAHPEGPIGAAELDRYWKLIARRKRFEPIQYIIGEREFYGLTFKVGPGVLIPRPETEHLVEAALERVPLHTPSRIADVGTGSGAIAVALAVARPLARITATDISAAALKIAKENAAIHCVADRVSFCEADLLGDIDDEYDMVVSNPPYIADAERETLDAEVREYEPSQALFAGPTGLEIYERLIPEAFRALRPGGWLLMEIGAGQQLQLSQVLKDWCNLSFVPDLQGIPRVARAQRP